VELVANLEERFRLLIGGRRSRMERHQTMRGTLDWSYDLCTHVEQAVFDRLSVFPAGLDLVAARAVGGGEGVNDLDVVDVVPQLVDRSLLNRSTASDGTTRYRMLETMRAYGREHLQHEGAADTTRGRHARYMADTIGALSLRTVGPDEDQVVRRLNEYLPDALVALDWFIDHGDWENGLRVTFAGHQTSERETIEMVARLSEAARSEGAPRDLLDEIERSDQRLRLSETARDGAERGWRALRSHAPIPTDRLYWPPHGDFNDGGLAAADVGEFVASLERWRSAPPVNRYYAEYFMIRSLAHNRHLAHVGQPLERFAAFVAQLHSNQASRGLAELYGVVSRSCHDWSAAAAWYGQIDAARSGGLRTWFDLTVAWHLLTARALCEEPFELTGAQLREPWHCLREQHIDVLQWHGATSTALALHRIGRDDVSDRLVAWAFGHDPMGSMSVFREVLETAGLPTAQCDATEDLDVVLDRVFAIADELDGGAG
ncbi:MAG TPA: hypothetical protein VLD86_09570, partial [Ilumatobacteraceae bacterium]|nr:hypothetical protein [Ilumatobacteraceae bacterium]